MAWIAAKIASVPPAVTVISAAGSMRQPCRRAAPSAIASQSAGSPAIGAYWLWPAPR